MKGRESGMPEKDIWEEFFDPAKILATLGMDEKIRDVVEFGCGYGTFTIPAARMVKGKVIAIDIDSAMTSLTRKEAGQSGLSNIVTATRDVVADGTGVEDESIDFVMFFNILHIEQPDILLREARRILRRGGKLSIIHWNYDPLTPRGPSMEIRPKPEDCVRWAEGVGFHSPQRYDLKPYHYGIVLSK
ncbi:MAG: class I SAM-dependent methyltransferase [Candidatus Omnitrophica bacterium]|nr:class I SAM-dependent methyltransferase [Candidatus Omnitrophota bacterium]